MSNGNLFTSRQAGINRYIMECKYTDVRGLGEAFSELIDTLWNVNEVVRIRCDLSTLELIDTLWNVNLIIGLMSMVFGAN